MIRQFAMYTNPTLEVRLITHGPMGSAYVWRSPCLPTTYVLCVADTWYQFAYRVEAELRATGRLPLPKPMDAGVFDAYVHGAQNEYATGLGRTLAAREARLREKQKGYRERAKAPKPPEPPKHNAKAVRAEVARLRAEFKRRLGGSKPDPGSGP